jgi:FMN-dependent NADH-azoreductase
VTGKKAIVVISTGGTPIESPYDFVKGYMQTFLGFIGITDVEFVISDERGTPEDKNAKAEENLVEI